MVVALTYAWRLRVVEDLLHWLGFKIVQDNRLVRFFVLNIVMEIRLIHFLKIPLLEFFVDAEWAEGLLAVKDIWNFWAPYWFFIDNFYAWSSSGLIHSILKFFLYFVGPNCWLNAKCRLVSFVWEKFRINLWCVLTTCSLNWGNVSQKQFRDRILTLKFTIEGIQDNLGPILEMLCFLVRGLRSNKPILLFWRHLNSFCVFNLCFSDEFNSLGPRTSI